MSAGFDRLIGPEVDRILGDLSRANPRALANNPEGATLVGGAIRDAIRSGVDAGCSSAGRRAGDLDFDRSDARERWQAERGRTPEASAWPAALEATAPTVVEDARRLLAAAGQELGLRGKALRRFQAAGAQAAEAGAALARALTEPSRRPDKPRRGKTAPVGTVQPDGSVRVAVAANQPETELLQGVLTEAGIPSTWRRTGGDLPELLAAGYREIYVPAGAATEAQALLATLDAPSSEDDPQPTRRVGLERTALRLIGKFTAALIVFSLLTGISITLAIEKPALGLVGMIVTLIAVAAVVIWSERVRSDS